MIDKTKLRLGQRVMYSPYGGSKSDWIVCQINRYAISATRDGFLPSVINYDELTPEDIIPTAEELAVNALIEHLQYEINTCDGWLELGKSGIDNLQIAIQEVEKSRGV